MIDPFLQGNGRTVNLTHSQIGESVVDQAKRALHKEFESIKTHNPDLLTDYTRTRNQAFAVLAIVYSEGVFPSDLFETIEMLMCEFCPGYEEPEPMRD